MGLKALLQQLDLHSRRRELGRARRPPRGLHLQADGGKRAVTNRQKMSRKAGSENTRGAYAARRTLPARSAPRPGPIAPRCASAMPPIPPLRPRRRARFASPTALGILPPRWAHQARPAQGPAPPSTSGAGRKLLEEDQGQQPTNRVMTSLIARFRGPSERRFPACTPASSASASRRQIVNRHRQAEKAAKQQRPPPVHQPEEAADRNSHDGTEIVRCYRRRPRVFRAVRAFHEPFNCGPVPFTRATSRSSSRPRGARTCGATSPASPSR